jgi:vancomycin permeability regulator SanA
MTILDQAHRPSGYTVYRAGKRHAYFARRRAAERAAGASLTHLTLHAAARGVALFFGLFALANLVGALRTPGFDQNIWWLDLRPLSASVSAGLLGLAGLLLVWWALRPAAPAWRRWVTVAALVALAVVALKNGVTFYRVWHEGLIDPWLGVPFSFVLAVALGLLAWAVGSPPPAVPRDRGWTRLCTLMVVVASLGVCGILFPLAQQGFFGKTSYARPVQTAIVLGAQVHRDGHSSITLADRVRTGAELYRDGLAQHLIMSGGQGADEPFNETSIMRAMAISYGVPAAAISVDPAGVNTDATVRDTVPMLRAGKSGPVAVVSDFFHLPRIKLAYQRAGLDVITVPSHARRIPQTTGLVIREIPAFWVYYLRAIL